MNKLVIIPARGGSKGIPGKNIKLLNGKPLITYAIDIARQIVSDEMICVTTDADEIIKTVEDYGLKVPFKRPDYLATDTMGTYDVLIHAVNFYENTGYLIDVVILLQPTSPFRLVSHVNDAIDLYDSDIDMVVSVKEAKCNPYYNCFEESKDGFLSLSKAGDKFHRRQDAPKAYEYNGSLYIISTKALKRCSLGEFTKIRKYVMPELYSVDLDTLFDWQIAETMLKNNMVKL